MKKWLGRLGVKTLLIERGSPWENGYIESFNGKLREECLNENYFVSLKEAKELIEKAEATCLISNSMKTRITLDPTIT